MRKGQRKLKMNNSSTVIAKKALREVKEIKSGIEQKFLNYANAGTSDIVLAYPLTQIGEGEVATSITRVGLKISPKHMKLRYMLSKDGTATASHEAVRLMLVRDTQQIGDATPAVTDVLEAALVTAQYKRVVPERFKVLYDKVHLLSDYENGKVFHQISKSWKSLNVFFNGSAETDIQKNGLYLYAFSDNTQTGKGATLTFDSRIRFTDN